MNIHIILGALLITTMLMLEETLHPAMLVFGSIVAIISIVKGIRRG